MTTAAAGESNSMDAYISFSHSRKFLPCYAADLRIQHAVNECQRQSKQKNNSSWYLPAQVQRRPLVEQHRFRVQGKKEATTSALLPETKCGDVCRNRSF
jgi:hypothetical protein